MSVGKLRKFKEIGEFKNVFQNYKEPYTTLYNCNDELVDYKGKWSTNYFKNNNPLILELACGEGYYTYEMGKLFPNKNFIGIDVKGNRIWWGAKRGVEEKIENIAFIRSRIENLTCFFAENEVSEIWITFPDPFLSERRTKNRLTFTRFLKMYQEVLPANAPVHLKTDSTELYEFTKEMIIENNCKILVDNDNIYVNGYDEPLLDIKTRYEKMHLKDNRTIKYLKFTFND